MENEQPDMITPNAKEKLEKQSYRVVGSHSAVKTCGWTKTMVRGEGGCYKLKFYGIMSNQCMQMTPSISCANRCSFCWRDYKAPVAKDWKWKTDDPEEIIEESVKHHHKLLEGFNKGKRTNQNLYEKSKDIKHVALSLTGEPITYPKINKMIQGFNKRGISTFLVTNAQYPEHIRDLEPVTQLYISLDAPEKVLLKKVDVPLFHDYWERLEQSLDSLKQKKERTCIRLTLIKNVNMENAKGYADLILRGDPDFLEIKAYMWVGASQERLQFENMPNSDEVKVFTQEILQFLPDYELVSEHYPSRVVMLAKRKFKKNGVWHTWIDFPKYDELVNNEETKNSFTTDDYLAKTPDVHILKKEVNETDEEIKIQD